MTYYFKNSCNDIPQNISKKINVNNGYLISSFFPISKSHNIQNIIKIDIFTLKTKLCSVVL